MLIVNDCAAAYGEKTVFSQISLELDYGSTATVVGPSGCGKSTLLAVLAGIKEAATGSVLLDGSGVGRGDRRIGLILQHYGLFPWMSVRQNVALGLRLRGIPREEREEIVEGELSRLDISELHDRYPAELSGGQQQRVAIARTFAVGPRLLLMDEPFSALDTLTRERIQDTLVERLGGDRVTTVLVTHSIEEAAYLGKTVFVFRPPGPTGVSTGLEPIENDHELGPAFRMSTAYADRCREIRRRLEEQGDA
ncbi:MAG TPA: ATP-binding cassette domain-containing protein [Spirochaetia bacterium]|nr:ATP-binding cassette domain-containing protein [Spirochaetia bacterium]